MGYKYNSCLLSCKLWLTRYFSNQTGLHSLECTSKLCVWQQLFPIMKKWYNGYFILHSLRVGMGCECAVVLAVCCSPEAPCCDKTWEEEARNMERAAATSCLMDRWMSICRSKLTRIICFNSANWVFISCISWCTSLYEVVPSALQAQ